MIEKIKLKIGYYFQRIDRSFFSRKPFLPRSFSKFTYPFLPRSFYCKRNGRSFSRSFHVPFAFYFRSFSRSFGWKFQLRLGLRKFRTFWISRNCEIKSLNFAKFAKSLKSSSWKQNLLYFVNNCHIICFEGLYWIIFHELN